MDHYVALRTASGAAAGEKGQAYLQSLVPLVHRNRDAVATDAILDAHCQQLSPTVVAAVPAAPPRGGAPLHLA